MSPTAKAAAASAFNWLIAYQEAGFTRGEAVALLVAAMSATPPSQTQYPPEMLEFLSKQSRVAERALEEDA